MSAWLTLAGLAALIVIVAVAWNERAWRRGFRAGRASTQFSPYRAGERSNG